MACGVPVVAENRWGWREMICHGQSGLLADSDDELAFQAARLAYDEKFRIEIARRARRALEEELANPNAIWAGWRALLGRIDVNVFVLCARRQALEDSRDATTI